MRTVTLRETEAPFGLVLEMHCLFDLAYWETSQDHVPSGGSKWPPWKSASQRRSCFKCLELTFCICWVKESTYPLKENEDLVF